MTMVIVTRARHGVVRVTFARPHRAIDLASSVNVSRPRRARARSMCRHRARRVVECEHEGVASPSGFVVCGGDTLVASCDGVTDRPLCVRHPTTTTTPTTTTPSSTADGDGVDGVDDVDGVGDVAVAVAEPEPARWSSRWRTREERSRRRRWRPRRRGADDGVRAWMCDRYR